MMNLSKAAIASGSVLVTGLLGITAQSASASTITNDSVVGTQYEILSVTEGELIQSGQFVTTFEENYAEDNLIPYLDGDTAIVDTDIPGGPNYFDKTITITQSDIDIIGNGDQYGWRFLVENNTPYDWTDYHFEFEEGTLETLGIDTIFVNSDPAANVMVMGDDVWLTNLDVQTGGSLVDLLEVQFFFGAGADAVPDETYGVRQIATTDVPVSTPEPGTILGLGLLGFGALYKRKLNQK
ncbi:PEP-CTERM sorting domain-containing protein [Crocosphaera chwakensis]|uniref:3-methyl-2-oxobutanoate hydroxymethyltransferase n=1 Tax=Crocosphaera chwakensis CCY0110 TaxID=391612 RepID=A3INK7_9CHRO|nr:PEP-CTERM sorting domain-containing protein [Crocosphaera chwakensis]EAZ91905.1 3-methyl-2-oxobutanoate hydroxymethyltransferase [Crocosphaera chwakensis CCY0110]